MPSTPKVSSPSNIVQSSDIRQVIWTGRTRNTTNASRTVINADLRVGQVVMLDPEGWDNGKGLDATQPFTAGISAKVAVGVVTAVPLNSRRGGPVSVCVSGPCRVLTADASVVLLDGIIPIDGAFTVADTASRDFTSYGIALSASADTTEKFIDCVLDPQAWGE